VLAMTCGGALPSPEASMLNEASVCPPSCGRGGASTGQQALLSGQPASEPWMAARRLLTSTASSGCSKLNLATCTIFCRVIMPE
jgi:hypothetical protein